MSFEFTDVKFPEVSGTESNTLKLTTSGIERVRITGSDIGLSDTGVSIGSAADPNETAILELVSTTKGLLLPRLTTDQRNAIVSPAEGLQIYNLTSNILEVYNGSTWIIGGGGSFNFNADLPILSATESVDVSTGSITTVGGLGVTKNANIGGQLALTATNNGFLPNRLTTLQRDALTPIKGLIIFNIDTQKNEQWDFNRGWQPVTNIDYDNELIMKHLSSNNYQKSYKDTHPSMFLYYDFSKQYDLGYDSSGNFRHGEPCSLEYTLDLSGRECAKFSQLSGTTSSSTILQMMDLNKLIPEIITLNECSISCWVYCGTSAGLRCIFSLSKNTNNTSNISLYSLSNGVISFQSRKDNVTSHEISSIVPYDGWHHVTIKLGVGGAELWIDNVLIASDTNTTGLSLLSGATHCSIGANRDTIGFEWAYAGYLSDFAIWNEKISTDLNTKLYNDDYGYECIALLGQSNMVGRAVAEAQDLEYSKINGKVFQFGYDTNDPNSDGVVTGSTITAATNPLDHISNVGAYGTGEYAGSCGFWKTFIEDILDTIPRKRKFLLLPLAKGNTNFYQGGDWGLTGTLYLASKSTINRALELNSYNRFVAVLFHMGEGERTVGTAANQQQGSRILAMHRDLIANASMDVNGPFIVGDIFSGETMVSNNNLRNFTNDITRFSIPALDLSTIDGTHFDAKSVRIMGKRYANAYKKCINARFSHDKFKVKELEYLGRNINIGTNVNITGVTNVSNSTDSTSAASGSMILSGGLGVTKNANIGGQLALTATNTGFLPNRLTTAQRDALTPATGLQIYNTNTLKNETYNGTSWESLTTGPAFDNSAALQLTNTTSSTSSSTGALRVSGGVGIAENLNVAGKITMSTTLDGFLPPRMTTAQKNAISSPVNGLVVYDSNLNKLCVYADGLWQTLTFLGVYTFTFTCTMGDGTNNFTISSQVSKLTKGYDNIKHVNISIDWTSKGSASGPLRLSLPEAATVTSGFVLSKFENITGWSGQLVAKTDNTLSYIYLVYCSTGTETVINCAEMSASGSLVLSGTYI